MSSALAALRIGMQALDRTVPAVAGAVAEQLFFAPPRRGLSPGLQQFLATGRRFDLTADGRRVVAWAWGNGPVVLHVHGWGSRGARWRGYVERLVAAGRTAVVFDGPGHGASAGRLSSMPEFARAILALAERFGPVEGVVAHSLGGAATALAMSWGFAPRRAVFLAPAADPAYYATVFADTFRLGGRTIAAMKTRSERRLRFRWSELHIPTIAPRMRAPLLVVHDRGDATVPLAEGQAISAHWPGAQLIVTDGLGHHEIVKDGAVAAQAVGFLTQ